MSFRKTLLMLLAASTIAASAFAQTTTTGTVTTQTTSPPIGLASSETIQVNLTNTASNSSSGTAASCAGTVAFLTASGATIGSASSFTATSGQTASVSLPFAKSGATGTRTEIRAVVSVTFTSDVPCSITSSLETYDTTTGVTHVYLANGNAAGAYGAPGGQGGGPGGH
ncbi:MAG TPA: hypothetical protein VML19_10970 [Verrucomicrobiae bacterium]|nr:hypothetical protein [Verrucomicrobiae bacterium]